MKKIVIIDSHALIHRAYHALPVLTSPQGRPVQAVYGFASVLMKVLKELKPEYAVAAFDMAGPTFRHKDFADYKAHRPVTDDELINQFPLVRELLETFGIPILEKQGFEADDIIGTVAERLKSKKDLQKIIVTGDMDCLQLVKGDDVVVYTLKKGVNDTVTYNEKAATERFGGLSPEQLTDFKGLKGDPSDNIPGVPGVGEKTAIQLLSKHGNIENLYKNMAKDKTIKPALKEKLLNFKDQAFLSKKLATINRAAPIDFDINVAIFDPKDNEEAQKFFFGLGFRSLIGRLAELKDNSGSRPPTPLETKLLTGQAELMSDEVEDYYKKGIFSPKIYRIEKALRPVLRKMEQTGVLLDTKLLVQTSRQTSTDLAALKKEIVKTAGEEFNINSTRELGKILFEKLNLGGVKVKRTKTGAYATNVSELEKLRNKNLIVPLILRWRELSKIKSTYLDALPKLVNKKDGRLHTTFKQFGAVTGRMASENPNLQNIPLKSEHGADVRKAFVAPPGWLLLSADYSQIELRVAAALSGDKKMIETFRRGEDIHARTAAEVFDAPLDKITKEMRREAKALNFGVLYGMGARAFAQSAGISLSEAQRFIREYESDFAGLAKFIKETKNKAYAQGYVETLWGRRRYLNDLSSANPGLRAAAERMAVNMPIQGTATGDIIKAAMVELDKKIGGAKDIKMLLQVHDQLIFEVRKDKVKKYAELIKKVMENIADLAVPLEVDIEAGKNWGEMKSLQIRNPNI